MRYLQDTFGRHGALVRPAPRRDHGDHHFTLGIAEARAVVAVLTTGPWNRPGMANNLVQRIPVLVRGT